ncbi:signal peptidase I [Kocuria coralli]|uniref:Signal peptidase I n=1 Tax=Kocuria coralli TaxID=1461025 RepID=A0A5J5L283_9MICC|nr:signal peptidase I [Kocuria coralli]KAA9395730.1 signal peptidase I [Kocuria coralli]
MSENSAASPGETPEPRPGNDQAGKAPDQEPGQAKEQSSGGFLKEILITVVVVLVISFLVKTFIFRIFFIPSGSMENTLQLDDKIGVNVAHSWYGDLDRGDIAVFEDTQGWMPDLNSGTNPVRQGLEFVGLAPDTTTQYVIKRVIGVGGDTVSCCDADGRVTVNDVPLDEPYLYEGDDPSQIPFEVTVPEGHYFMMGDHRSASGDSRYHIEDGSAFISDEDVVGTAMAVVWPMDRWTGLSSQEDTFARVEEASGSGQ